jgi:transposase InsO family protein
MPTATRPMPDQESSHMHAIQWLSDNGPQYTATASVLYAHELGLVPITTPAYSPESNGLARAGPRCRANTESPRKTNLGRQLW